jgi:nucleotide-binding universal stress UspA family protein
MYEKILVPLDGSEVAECALTHTMNLAKAGLVGEVVLLGVVEINLSWGSESRDFANLQHQKLSNSEEYLARIQSRFEAQGLKASAEVMVGRADQTIITFCEKQCRGYHRHRKSWLYRYEAMGVRSVAWRVLQIAECPVLLIKPDCLV